MKRRLLIVGAGGHGRCCLDIAKERNVYDEIAFLDDQLVNKAVNDCKVIGTVKQLSEFQHGFSDVFIAIGNNKLRFKLLNQAKEVIFQSMQH